MEAFLSDLGGLKQVEAIKNISIDKVTVWDSGGVDGKPGATAGFLSGLFKSLPPLHDVAAMAGLDLPRFLGEVSAAGQDKDGKKEK